VLGERPGFLNVQGVASSYKGLIFSLVVTVFFVGWAGGKKAPSYIHFIRVAME